MYHDYADKPLPDIVRDIYFSSRGRLSPHAFSVYMGLYIIFVPLSIFALWKLCVSLPNVGKLIAICCLLLLLFYNFLMLIVKRLHDTGHNGFFAILTFIPILNAFFFFYLVFKKGGRARNRFGHPCLYRPPIFLSIVAYPFFCLFMLFHVAVLVQTSQSVRKRPHIIQNPQSIQEITEDIPVFVRSIIKKLGLEDSMAIVSVDGQMITISTFITPNRLLVRKKEIKETIQNALAQNKKLQVKNLQDEAFIIRLVAYDDAVQMAVFETDRPIGSPHTLDEYEMDILEKMHAFR